MNKFYSNQYIIIRVTELQNPTSSPIIKFAIGKKVGKAVVRNRIRRLMREVLRLNREKLSGSLHLTIIVKPVIAKLDLNFSLMEKILFDLFKKAKIIKCNHEFHESHERRV